MYFYRVFPNTNHALDIPTSYRELTDHLYKLWTNQTDDLSILLAILEPFIASWKRILKQEEVTSWVDYSVLIQQLKTTFPQADPWEVIKTYVEETELLSSLEDELTLILIETLRNPFIRPFNDKSEAFFAYCVAVGFRGRLKNNIATTYYKYKNTIPLKEVHEPVVEDCYVDIYLLDRVASTKWEVLLLDKILDGWTTKEIADLLAMPRETLYYEEKNIWKKLKHLYCAHTIQHTSKQL